jgi:GIY-YIG catalytic domain
MNKPVYYVYRLTIKGTRMFYIGVTENLESRRSQHFTAINSIINRLRFSGWRGSKTKNGYYKVAAQLMKGKRFLAIENCFTKEMCKMTVLGIKNTSEEARELEHSLIKQHIKHVHCFNRFPRSTYTVKSPKQAIKSS